MSYDPHDPEQVEDRANRRRVKASPEQVDLRWVTDDPRGRRAIARILLASGWDAPSHIPGDTHATAYREGQRSIGMALRAVLASLGNEALIAVTGEAISPRE